MEHCGGEIRAEEPELSNGGDGGGTEDRISALPDDVLIHILLKLCDAAVAARTSVLAKRWLCIWKRLPQLLFFDIGSLGIRSALESHEAPALDLLWVGLKDANPESVEAWLKIAAHRLSGDLKLINLVHRNEAEDEALEGASFELPCFENATSIFVGLDYLGLTVPPLGVFARLTGIFLSCIKLHGPCMLGDAVSSPRCPVLRKLTVHDVWGLENFAIHSDSLLEIELKCLHDLQQLTVMAPALKLLDVRTWFAEHSSNNQPVANICAPQLVSLFWGDVYDPRFMQFGKMENLTSLGTNVFYVYGKVGSRSKLQNSYWMELLRSWRHIHNLRVVLVFPTDITNCEYLMEDSTRFPNIRNLALDIVAKGHSCGASLYHVLKMCTGVTELYLTLLGTRGSLEAEAACLSGCVCDQPPNWKTDKFVLNCLQEVKISNLRGTHHEAGLVKRLFDWATVLETMTVTFNYSIAESKAREFCQMIQSFSRPEICLKGGFFT